MCDRSYTTHERRHRGLCQNLTAVRIVGGSKVFRKTKTQPRDLPAYDKALDSGASARVTSGEPISGELLMAEADAAAPPPDVIDTSGSPSSGHRVSHLFPRYLDQQAEIIAGVTKTDRAGLLVGALHRHGLVELYIGDSGGRVGSAWYHSLTEGALLKPGQGQTPEDRLEMVKKKKRRRAEAGAGTEGGGGAGTGSAKSKVGKEHDSRKPALGDDAPLHLFVVDITSCDEAVLFFAYRLIPRLMNVVKVPSSSMFRTYPDLPRHALPIALHNAGFHACQP